MSETGSKALPAGQTVQSAERLRQRIVQYRGRRFSIKLEPEFWSWLEGLAATRGLRLNTMIAEIAAKLPEDVNLASGLRQYCLLEASQRIVRLEDRVLELSLASGFTNLATIIEANPAPALLVSSAREVLKVNGSFARWSGIARGQLVGRAFDHVFSLATSAPLPEVWEQFARGYPRPVPAKLTYLAPGRWWLPKRLYAPPVSRAGTASPCLS